MPEYTVSKQFVAGVTRTDRVLEVAEAFGLGLDAREFVVFDDLKITIEPGDVVYITGQSGAGKTVLLKELEAQMKAGGLTVANLADVVLDPALPVINQLGVDTADALRHLSAVGISDAFLYLRTPDQLSDGQRYRLRLAKVIEARADVWLADEFLAVLDRATAKVIAYTLQKLARQRGAILVVATTHPDLKVDLHPSLYIEKRYREKVRVEAFADALKRAVSAPYSKDEIMSLLRDGIA